MKLLKTKQPQAVPVVGPSLADRIKETCAATDAYIETVVAKEKIENPLISVDWIRMNLKLMHGKCACRCVLALIEKENNASR